MADENLTINLKVSADTSGAQQAKQALSDVQNAQQAAITRGLQQALQTYRQGVAQANQQLRQVVAATPGTTAADVRFLTSQIAGATGARPTLTAAELGIGPRAAQSAGEVASQTERAARSASEMHGSFSEIARVGAGLFGIGLGLNLAAGVARELGRVIAGIAEGQIAYERTLRETNALWGAQATTVQAVARAQSQMADQAGTTQEHIQAINALGASMVGAGVGGFTPGELARAPAAGFRLSQALNEDEQTRRARQEAIRAYITGGGPSLASVGVAGTPQETARSLGFRSEQALGALTPEDLTRARELTGIIALNRAAITAPGGQPAPFLTAQAEAQKKLEDAQSSLRDAMENSATRVSIAFQGIGAVPGGLAAYEAGGVGPYETSGPALEQLRKAVEDAQAQVDKWSQEIGNANSEIAKATDELNKLGVTTNSATARLLDFAGSVEDVTSIARGDIAAAAQAGVAQRAQPVNPLIAQTSIEKFVTATQQAEQAAYRQFVAGQAQQQLLQNSGIREFLQRQATTAGPGLEDQRARAQAALDDIARRRAGALGGIQAQQAGQFADRAAQEASAQLQRIQIAQDERRLAVSNEIVAARRAELETAGRLVAVNLAQRTIQAQATLASDRLQSIQINESQRRLGFAEQQAEYAKQSIQVQQQMSPLLLQQAALQDRITVASRDNLDIRKQLIAAQQAALPSQGALSELNYQQQRIQLLAQARQAALIQGQQPGGPSFAELTQQYVQGELQRPQTELAALDAQQAVARAQLASTQEGLGRQMQGADLEEQARALQDQLIPLQATQRAQEANAQSLQQYLDLLDLEDTKAKVAAESAVNMANQQAIALNQVLVPMQLAADAAGAYTQSIQNALALQDLGDESNKAFWQTAADYASTLKLDADAAARSASDYSANLNLGTTPAEAIAQSLERGQAALEKINSMTSALGGQGPLASNGGTGGVNVSGITVNVSGAGDEEAVINEATRQFEVQFRQALRASGASPPPVTSSLVGARRG